MKFTTKDRDNDYAYYHNCAAMERGAWWYKACSYSNLNGHYFHGGNTHQISGITWSTWKGFYYSMKSVVMKIKPYYQKRRLH